MNPNDIDTSRAERIGFFSTYEEGKTHWTELAVWFLTEERWRRRPFLSELVGKSRIAGQVDKVQRISGGSFEKVVRLFDDTAPARAAIEEARNWLRDHGRDEVTGLPRSFALPKTDEEALTWLYGQPDEGTTLLRMLSRDFDIGESTIRAALKNGTPVKLPLLSVLRWFDREAFRRDRENGKLDGEGE
ncbi:hypothetical protein HRJ34_14990 [Rhizorhabdus wittichii]|uniref:Uncharacterized protein n=1 Tax=Rhizorhabdus wittichii TaxID=160791 RepID=A0A975HDF3_9SPHN|nr:hypothetical protein [Rhizorhabdus wittichii]QTH19679.1 hypothetical protein HRJ34_14990 [Rhizorhabdus wittichii]